VNRLVLFELMSLFMRNLLSWSNTPRFFRDVFTSCLDCLLGPDCP
jgi:hypothetical protein